MKTKKTQVVCPYCGYKMPIYYGEKAFSQGLHVTCKGRNCKNIFEIKINKGLQQQVEPLRADDSVST